MKYVHLFLNESINENSNIEIIAQKDGCEIERVSVYLEKGKKQTHRNIPIYNSSVEHVEINGPLDLVNKCSVLLTEQVTLSSTQRDYDEKNQIKQEINDGIKLFFKKKLSSKSRKLLVTFPGFASIINEVQYPIDFKDDSDVNQLAFQDRYLTNGSYMKLDNTGRKLKDNIKHTIQATMYEMNIEEKDVCFYGVSKGATVAIEIGQLFKEAMILAIAPQMDLDFFFKDTYIFGNFHKNILGRHLDRYENKIDVEESLNLIITNNQRCSIWMGEKDFYSNSLQVKTQKNLRINEFPVGHNDLIKKYREI